MKRATTIRLTAGLLAIAGYVVFRHDLPPMTCLAHARLGSSLAVPRNARILSCKKSDWMWNSSAELTLEVDPAAFEQLRAEATSKGYRPMSEAPADSSPVVKDYRGRPGWFFTENIEHRARFVVLDPILKRMILYDTED